MVVVVMYDVPRGIACVGVEARVLGLIIYIATMNDEAQHAPPQALI
jgi:hypothetical protein